MDRMSAIIESLKLSPHPEGGFYRETYRSTEIIPAQNFDARFDGDRHCCTAIYFLLGKGDRSHLHRIKSDEIWHYYEGGPLSIIELTPEGNLIKTLLGPTQLAQAKPQYVVRAGHWFGAFPAKGTEFTLVGCTVSPGFDFKDFELATSDLLVGCHGALREELEKFIKA